MSRAIGSWILINILLVACRGWFFRTTFGNSHQWWWLLVLSCISSGLLASFPRLADQFSTEALLYTHLANINGWWRALLLGALICIPALIYILLWDSPRKETRRIIAYFFILWWGSFFALIMSPRVGLASRLLIALIEERTKTSTTLALYDRLRMLSSDLIFFWLISALGFAFVENSVYLRNLWTASVASATWLVIKRTLTSWVMHLTYTGLIAVWCVTLVDNKKQRPKWIAFLLAGIFLHTFFNATLQTTPIIVTLGSILFWYLFMSWLIYKSERVYIS